MQTSSIPWLGDEGQQLWEQVWMAIKKVWASKWNERAYFSTRKVKLGHDYLCMAVLVQEIINSDNAFVIHTTNPLSGDLSEIYAEVLGYPSKPIGLFIRWSIIFRYDSNGEDLEGYAGAGLYDRRKVVLDYSSDLLIIDAKFRRSILSNIACAESAIEELHGYPQDIEDRITRNQKYTIMAIHPGAKYGKHLSKEETENDSANVVAVPSRSSSHANVGLPNAVHGNKTRYGGHRRAIFASALVLQWHWCYCNKSR
ncbi:pyruvate phosphate dikinase, PEP/pyruvate binding domain-containing protein [Actinidia rufa]|uniref:Pyruvate phosphate dikinase, PEP/pyruvate binding domain-containing protein n=1 Tax=Actinidia rufa TaxID=165716 RepID=A0A7J0GDX8_9ERIC|nr:pyruvate phosphate dikinase, PEP/pyruvate binding domain-containing protein [Actinidia rufa]